LPEFLKRMQSFSDQLNRIVKLQGKPQRIVSLVPSITELLFDLGLGSRIVGCTKFCVHPASMPPNVIRIGGTKNPKIETIKSLKPDLIIANKEENNQVDIIALANFYPVWVSDVKTVQDALQMIAGIGKITETESAATAMVSTIERQFELVKAECSLLPPLRVVYLIWKNPYMAAGSKNFINSILGYFNLENELSGSDQRYPVIEPKQFNLKPVSFILLSSEPYPFKKQHIEEIESTFAPAKAIVVDGEMFSWYGSRMLHMKEYLLTFRKKLNS
jgi:ABC-type Fe3+-hydroxamate transport system substrate-binding protein